MSWRDAQTAAERLRPSDGSGAPARDRRGVRVAFRAANLTVSIAHPNGSVTVYSVIPRNLSTHGFAFLHGRFLYIGSPCRVELPALGGGATIPTAGKVVNCRHVSGIMHEVAVRFDAPVELAHFVALSDEEQQRALSEYRQATGATGDVQDPEPRVLSGHALVVDDFQADRDLLRMRMTKLGLNVTTVDTIDAAIEASRKQTFDVVLLDMSLGGGDCAGCVRKLREARASKAIIALSDEDTKKHRESALAAGCVAFIVKPFSMAALTQALTDCLTGAAGPVVSSMQDDPDMLPLVESYIADAQRMIEQIDAAVQKDDAGALLQIARQLKGSGSSHGFDVLTKFAGAAVDCLTAEKVDFEAARGAVSEMVNVVRRLSV